MNARTFKARKSRSAILLYFLLIIFPLSVTALALIDVGRIYSVRGDVERTLSASARAGAVVLASNGSVSAAEQAASGTFQRRCQIDPQFTDSTSGCSVSVSTRSSRFVEVSSDVEVKTWAIGLAGDIFGINSLRRITLTSESDSLSCGRTDLVSGCFTPRG